MQEKQLLEHIISGLIETITLDRRKIRENLLNLIVNHLNSYLGIDYAKIEKNKGDYYKLVNEVGELNQEKSYRTIEHMIGKEGIDTEYHAYFHADTSKDNELQDFLTDILSRATTKILINSGEHEKAIVDNATIKEDLKLAKQIQKSILPGPLDIPGYDIYGITRPSEKDVGGDFFYYRKIDQYRIIFAISDVMGKRIAASTTVFRLYTKIDTIIDMALELAELQYSEIMEKLLQGPEILERLSKRGALFDNTKPPFRFATYFQGIQDIRNHELTYVNAGHDPPLILSDGTFRELKKGGRPIGFSQIGIESDYRVGNETLNSGDILFLYTDGVTEAHNRKWDDDNAEQFGIERLKDSIYKRKDLSSKDIIMGIYSDIKKFAYRRSLNHDDTTMVATKKL